MSQCADSLRTNSPILTCEILEIILVELPCGPYLESPPDVVVTNLLVDGSDEVGRGELAGLHHRKSLGVTEESH